VVDAVLAAQSANPASAARAVKQLQAWVEREDWETILPAYARCVRIIRSASLPPGQLMVMTRAFMVDPEEERLFDEVLSLQPNFNDVDEFLNAVVALIPAINAFFDNVLVMAEDDVVRHNRLALVAQIASLPHGLVDLSKLEGF
jgi:glycyl-tRNA synthetase